MEQKIVPILSAKIQVPPLPEPYVSVPRIEECLSVASGEFRGLVYLSAPPGYGKTTYLAQLAHGCGLDHAWITFDNLDTDLRRAAIYLNEALTHGGIPPEDISAPGSAPGAAPGSDYAELILVALSRIERHQRPFLLIMDDAHELSGTSFFHILRGFLEHMPSNCRVAIATREDLPLPLSVHRQAERLIELRQEDLRASEEEAEAYLQLAGIILDQESGRIIRRRVAGWWTCLKLFSISWKKLDEASRPAFLERFRATDRFVAEFLLESVYAVLSPELALYAACVAVPEFFSEELGTVLYAEAGGSGATALQAAGTLRRMNLVGRRAGEREDLYRFHPLVREYLRHTLSRETRAALHKRTAEWMSAKGLAERAARHREHARRLGHADQSPAADQASELPASTQPASGFPTSTQVPAGTQPAFSKRERELIEAVAFGLANDEIAERLFISTGTVKWHLNNIYAKLNARNRTEALRKAREQGLLS